jgi:hypothetical protein
MPSVPTKSTAFARNLIEGKKLKNPFLVWCRERRSGGLRVARARESTHLAARVLLSALAGRMWCKRLPELHLKE